MGTQTLTAIFAPLFLLFRHKVDFTQDGLTRARNESSCFGGGQLESGDGDERTANDADEKRETFYLVSS